MVAQGGTYTWQAIVKDGAGNLADPSDLTLVVSLPLGGVAPGFPVPFSSIVRDGLGLYHYDWAVPLSSPLGTYPADWSGVLDGAPLAGSDSVTVTPAGSVSVPSQIASAPYQTPGRFRSSRAGKAFGTGVTDIEVSEALWDATAIVDAYCNVPMSPSPHSFLGGRAVNEAHPWRYSKGPFDRPSYRIYPLHWPVIEIESVGIVAAAGVSAEVPVNQLVVNNAERWAEVSALVITTGTYVAQALPLHGLTEALLEITYTYGRSFAETDDRLTPIEDGSLVYQSSHPHWIDDGIVKVDGVAVSSGITVDRLEGRVTFEDDPGGLVTATYTHRLPAEIPRATGLIAASLIGASSPNVVTLLGGLHSIRVNEISMTRPQSVTRSGEAIVTTGVPQADMLLSGFRYARIA